MDAQRASTADMVTGDLSEELATTDGRIEMAQEDIDAIIRNKRKVRDPKACYACHRRKVKCDRNLPCDSCVKRDHPELCSYERPTKKRRIALAGAPAQSEAETQEPALQSGPNVTVPREQWERLNRELQRLRDSIKAESLSPGERHMEVDDGLPASTRSRSDEAEREGIHAPSNQMGTMHLGSRSVLAYMMALGRSQTTQDTARSLLEENILPKLGLDNESATYPFVDLWSTASSMQDVSGLCKAIPDDELCREFFVAYRDIAGTLYPVIPDAASFEDTLTFMLSNRARAQRDNLELDPNKPYGVSLAWLSLVFAVFASGSQCADRPAKERELTSQVYICCSYQALRMANFLTHPCLETIEASLIIGNVLSYNMNPGVAYIFLGMTLRMAFSIGLQINSNHFTEAEKWTRRRIWWALAWQDSHFAVSYDRPTSSVLCIPDIPYGKYSSPGDRSYAESMFAIIRLTQEIVRERLLHPRAYMTWDTIRKYTDEIANIVALGADHLRDRSKCYRTTQHLERLALKLHSSYITSELCRPALKEPSSSSTDSATASNLTPSQSPGGRRKSSHPTNQSPHSPSVDSATRAQLRRDCVQALEGAVAAYVELHSCSKAAARSWIGIQRAISAAFLLGTLPDTGQDQQRLSLLRELEQVIAQRTTEDPTFDLQPQDGPSQRRMSGNEPPPLADSPHWVRSMAKSLNALGKLNATLNGSKSAAKYPYLPNIHSQTNSPGVFMGMGGNPAAAAQSQNQSNLRTGVPSLGSFKQEPYSPALATSGILTGNSGMSVGSGGMGLGPITPDSTGSSSDWNFGNLHERAAEFVQAPLWGDGGVGSYLG